LAAALTRGGIAWSLIRCQELVATCMPTFRLGRCGRGTAAMNAPTKVFSIPNISPEPK
jgi:hypothetical protein